MSSEKDQKASVAISVASVDADDSLVTEDRCFRAPQVHVKTTH